MGLTFRAVELHCLKNLLKDLRASQCLLEEEPHWITTETPLCLTPCTQLIAKSHRLYLLTNPGIHQPLSTSSTRTRVRDTIVLNSGAPQSQLAFASPLCLPFVHFPHGSLGDFLLFKMKIRLRPHCILALTLQRFPIGLRIKAKWLNHLEGPLQSSPCLTGKPHLIPLSPVPWAVFVSPQDPCTCPFFYLGSIPFPVEQVERDRVHSHREQLGKRKGWRPKALNTSREPMLSYIIGGTTFLKTFWQYWLKLNVRRPNNSTPRCAPNRHAYVSSSQESIRMFTAALLVTALNT